MPTIATTIHDPIALAVTCRRLNLPAPVEGCLHLEAQEACGWIVRLPGVRFPVVCNTLTGLVAYHPHDNAFGPYRCIMQIIHRYYHVRAQLRQGKPGRNGHQVVASRGRPATLAAVGS